MILINCRLYVTSGLQILMASSQLIAEKALHPPPRRVIHSKWKSREIKVGDLYLGGDQPIVVQSMTTTDTMNIDATVQQVLDLDRVGCQIVRITAPTVPDAEALKEISARVRKAGSKVPLVADIHFVPAAAMTAADYVEKVRVNPGNYADRKLFKTRDYTDSEYQEELERIHERFKPLVLKLKDLGRALRIGTNHGSLSDRVMNRYGDTPEGMVASAFEFAEICRYHDFHNFCFSMKASNVGVMIRAYRLLVERQMERGWDYPLHLGVTEAGDGEDGRIKSSVGIGSLLAEGIGDTIRVSLTEASVKEIPVARALAEAYPKTKAPIVRDYLNEIAESSSEKKELPQVWMSFESLEKLKTDLAETLLRPDVLLIEDPEIFATEAHHLKLQLKTIYGSAALPKIGILTDSEQKLSPRLQALVDFKLSHEQKEGTFWLANGTTAFTSNHSLKNPEKTIVDWDLSSAADELGRTIDASVEVGALFVDFCPQGILLRGTKTADEALRLSFGILQATRRRMSKTEYISCPSCGRTLFDLEETTAKIKTVTSHLKGVKIAVMGCIVNGPGEMADADFGYVGGAPGRVNLYVGKDCVERNIASVEAPGRLVGLIKKHDRWIDPS